MSGSAACRILVVSSTTDVAHQFVQRVKALSDIIGGTSRTNSQVASTSAPATDDEGNTTPSLSLSKLHAELTNSDPAITIPWTISNKYYTADVHFELRQLDGFAGYLASDVPAVVYVWNRGDQYKTHVTELAKKLEHYDPEVSLAVQFSSDSSPAEREEDGEGLDEFISSHGFEYIDGDRGYRKPTQDGSSFSDEDAAGVPGLPRVIDSLSTIMWPSLVQSQRTTQRKSRAGDLLDWASMQDASGALLLQDQDHEETHDLDVTPNRARMQKEMDALESWLQDDLPSGQLAAERDHDDPWSTAGAHDGEPVHAHALHEFEDDFDDFVGAPMDVSYGDARRATSAPERAFTTDFVPLDDEHLHDVHAHEDDDEEEEDPELPSRAEVEEMSRRLFGSASLGLPSTAPSWQRLHSPLVQSGSVDQPNSSTADPSFDSLTSAIEEREADGEDDEFELGAFDLSKVLGALQGMKEQIAGMDDEGERRKAAAKVALGLVYGLQKEDERTRE
ncbi:hypothetical protein BDW22DRAFT_1401015 [Trametopsis cervina]|nr:hypothetical protein BDW22DRAFT_1401015 [Trametopsis cervina]